ncbi:MAG: condensation domain-containing protein, partial [Bacteroidota bacterium]
RNPLFDIGYTFINELDISHQRSESEFSNLDVSYLGDEFEFIKADLWLKILDLSGDLMVDLSYNINLFKDITIKKIMEDMSFILNNVLENAENTVDDLCANAEKHAENTGNKNKRALKEKNISLLREMSV